MDFAAFVAIDNLDRYELNLQPPPRDLKQHIRFVLKVPGAQRERTPGWQMDEPESTLSVRQGSACEFRNTRAHPTIHNASQPGDCARVPHAIANDDLRMLRQLRQETGNVGYRMLPIAIHGDGPRTPERYCMAETASESGPFAL